MKFIDLQGEIFIFCCSGILNTKTGEKLQESDALHIENTERVKLRAQTKVMAISLEIKYLR